MLSASRNLALSFTAIATLLLTCFHAAAQSIAPAQTIVIDAASAGRIFDGVGAISGGGGNPLLAMMQCDSIDPPIGS